MALPDWYEGVTLFWDNPLPDVPKKPGRIPKTIHQMWVGPRKRPARWMDTWPAKHPDWQYVLWDNESIKQLTFKNQHLIDAMPEWNGKCDIMRYEILHQFGGVFMDADCECLEPLDDFLLDNDSFSCFENESERGALVACGIMGATKGCRLMELCADNFGKIQSPAWWYVGPVYFTWAIHTFQYTDLNIYPSHWFLPSHYQRLRYDGPDKVYSDHHWGNTFHLYGD